MADAPSASDKPTRPRPQWHDAHIAEMIDDTPDVKRIRFKFDGVAEGQVPFKYRAGQWVALRAPAAGGRPATRAYSIASPPQEERFLELCIKEVPDGKLTPFLFKMQVGDSVKIRSPQGHFVLHEELPGDLVFVATGTGVAPFWSMANDLISRGLDRDVWLFFGVRYEEDIIYEKGLAELAAKNPRFKPIVTLSRARTKEWAGERGYVQVQMKKHLDRIDGAHVYICGLRGMVDGVLEAAHEMGFNEDRIFFERYD